MSVFVFVFVFALVFVFVFLNSIIFQSETLHFVPQGHGGGYMYVCIYTHVYIYTQQ